MNPLAHRCSTTASIDRSVISNRPRPAIYHRSKADEPAATMVPCHDKRKLLKFAQSILGSLVIISYLFVTDESILGSSYAQSGSLRGSKYTFDEGGFDRKLKVVELETMDFLDDNFRGSPVDSRRELANLERKLMPILTDENTTATPSSSSKFKTTPLPEGIEAKEIKTYGLDKSKHTMLSGVERKDTGDQEDDARKQPNVKSVKETKQSPEVATSATKSFHIIQASPPHSRSTIATNWLMGLFEPDADFSFMINRPDFPVRQSRKYIDLSETIVTKTHNIQIQKLYNTFRSDYDEVFFVVTQKHSEDDSKTRLKDEDLVCRYKNVLCLEFEEFVFQNQEELTRMVHTLTKKLKTRFEYFFGEDSEWFDMQHELNAVDRLEEMVRVTQTMEGYSFRQVTSKHGIHGGQFAALFKNYGETSVAED